MIPEWLTSFNEIAWVLSNVLIVYIGIVLIFFAAGYYILFDPRATTGGKLVFQFTLSLIGVIGLVFMGIFLNPGHNRTWDMYPGDIFWWRPAVRLVVYGYVAFTITNLAVLIVIRKWWPAYLRTARDIELLRARSEPK